MSIHRFKIIRVTKMGRNLVIRIPANVAKDMDLKPGDYLKIEWDMNRIILTKIE